MSGGYEHMAGKGGPKGLFCLRVVPGAERQVASLLVSAGEGTCLPTVAELTDASAQLLLPGMVVFEASDSAAARRVLRSVLGISDCIVPGAAPEPLDAEVSKAIRVLVGESRANTATLAQAEKNRLPISRISRTKRHAYVRLRLPDGPHELAVSLAGLS